MTTPAAVDVLEDLLTDLKRREKDLDGLRAQYLRQALNPTSENQERLDREEAERLRSKLEGLRLAIGVVEGYRKREGV